MSSFGTQPASPPVQENKTEEGIRIASFDGGGPGSYSQLLMLKEVVRRIEWDKQSQGDVDSDEELDFNENELCPADYFDLMGGVGFGAYCALMLGRLRFSIKKATIELIKLAQAIFPNTPSEILTPEANLDRLKNVVEDMLRRNDLRVDIPFKGKMGKGRQCKVVVFISAAFLLGDCTPFHSYSTRSSDSPRCTFVEAACAALAESSEFSPVMIGDIGVEIAYAGIPLGVNNPTRKILHEARMAFGEQRQISLILSMGAGKQPTPSIHFNASLDNCRVTLLTRFATDSEKVNDELVQQLGGVDLYLRLDVDRGLEEIKTSDWHQLSTIGAHTQSYLRNESVNTSIDKALRSVHNKDYLTFAQLYGATCQAVSRAPIEQVLNGLEREVKDMRNIVVGGLKEVTIIDAIGNRTSIPLNFCATYEMLEDMIKLYFKHQKPPGNSFVDKGDYKLVYGKDRKTVKSGEWTYLQAPNLELEMSMVVRKQGDFRIRCPKCSMGFRTKEENGWAICSNQTCKLRYQYQGEKYEKVRAFKRKKSASLREAANNDGSPVSLTETAERVDQFRLVSVVHRYRSSNSYYYSEENLLMPGLMSVSSDSFDYELSDSDSDLDPDSDPDSDSDSDDMERDERIWRILMAMAGN